MEIINRKTKKICLVLFLVHVSISQFILPMFYRSDVSPLYTWNLFSFTGAYYPMYFIKIHKVNGIQLEESEWVFQNRTKYTGNDYFNIPYQIKLLGDSLKKNYGNKSINQQVLENNLFFQFSSADYEVFYADAHLRQIILTKEVNAPKSLGRFTYSKEQVSE